MGRPFGLLGKPEGKSKFSLGARGRCFLAKRWRGRRAVLSPLPCRCRASAAGGQSLPGGMGQRPLQAPRRLERKPPLTPQMGFLPRERAALSGENLGRTGENRKNRRINVYIISGKDNTNPPFQMGGNRVQWRQNTPAGCRKEKGGHHHESIDA